MRDTDGDRGIEVVVAAEIDRIIDRRVEKDDLDENTKKILTNMVQKMKDPINLEAVNLRNVDRKKMKEKPQAVNQVLSWIHTESITEANLFIFVGANVAELVGKKRSKHENNNKIPWWKQHIQTSIAKLRRHVAQLQEWNRGKLSKSRVKADLERKYYVKNKGLKGCVSYTFASLFFKSKREHLSN